MRLEGPILKPEKPDLRPERLDLRPDRPDLRPNGPELRLERYNGRTNKQTNKPFRLKDLIPGMITVYQMH